MTDFYPHLPSHLDLYCKSCSYFICSFLPSVPYVFIPFLFYVPSLHFMCDCLLFTSYAFIKHLYVVTLLPSFITLCEPVFCVCVVCVLCVCCVLCILLCKLYHVLVPVSLSQTVIHTRCHVSPMNIYQFIILLVLPWPCSSALGHLGHFQYVVLACWK